MNRFLVPCLAAPGNKITITDKKQVHHIKDVLHLKAGKPVALFDGLGNEAQAEIERISETGIKLIISQKPVLNPRKSSINIACAIPKKSKFDDIVDKLTQLGVDRIIPLKTERAVVKLSIQKGEARLQRWVKIALSAAQQSQRSILPQISPLTDFRELIKKSTGFNLKLIPTLEGERKTLKEALSPVLPLPANILILIGPEGDFSPKEIDLALKHNFIPVSLGSTVLRVETAAIAVASFINLNEDR